MLTLTIFTLTGCNKLSHFWESQDTSATEGVSPDQSLEHLMKAVFPQWKPGEAISAEKVYAQEETPTPILLFPSQVIRLNDQEIVLIVQGNIDDSINEQDSIRWGDKGHSGAYWFKKEGEQWKLTERNDSFSDMGMGGAAAPLKPVMLGAQHQGLAQEGTMCSQGTCESYVNFFEIGSGGYLKNLAPAIQYASEDTGTSISECTDWLKHPHPPKTVQIAEDPDIGPIQCRDVTSQWSIVPNAKEPYGQLVLKIQENRISLVNQCEADEVKANELKAEKAAEPVESASALASSASSTVTASTPTEGASSALPSTAAVADPSSCTTYTVHPYRHQHEVIYRLVNGRWVVIKGDNSMGQEYEG